MKIINQTESEMVIADKGILSSALRGSVFVIVGLVILFMSGFQPVVLIMGAVFVGVGSLVVLKASSIKVAINKGSGQILFQKDGVLKHQSLSYNIADAIRIDLRDDYQSTGGRTQSRPTLVWQSVLIFKDGTELPLENLQAPGQKNVSVAGIGMSVLGGGKAKEAVVGQQIAAFLGIPFQEAGAPDPAAIGAIIQGITSTSTNPGTVDSPRL